MATKRNTSPKTVAPTPPTTDGMQSIAMIERVVFEILQTSFELIPSNPQFIDRLFRLLDADERAMIKQYLTERKVQIHHSYARSGYDLPTLNIVLGNEGDGDPEALDGYLGEQVNEYEEDEDDDAPGTNISLYGGPLDTNIQVWIYAETPDLVQYIYKIARVVLKAAKPMFSALQVQPGRMTGGDVAPREDWLPTPAFGRMIQIAFSGIEPYAVEPQYWKRVTERVHVKLNGRVV